MYKNPNIFFHYYQTNNDEATPAKSLCTSCMFWVHEVEDIAPELHSNSWVYEVGEGCGGGLLVPEVIKSRSWLGKLTNMFNSKSNLEVKTQKGELC